MKDMTRRKPVQRQIAEGDPRKKGMRKLRQELNRQPRTVSGLPECPQHLQGRARAAWDFLKEQLETMDLDARPDALALEGCCTSYAIAADAEEILTKEGLQVESPIFHRGVRIGTERSNNPALRIRNQAWARFLQFADRLGLSPQARQSLAVDRPRGASDAEIERLLSGPMLSDPEKQEILRSYKKN
jgi:P27 family predicted phage terminase small subunit